MVGDRGVDLERARTDALDPDPSHRLRNSFLVHRHALVVEICGDPWSPVAALGCLVVLEDPHLEPGPPRLRTRRLDAVSCLLPLVVPYHRYIQQTCHLTTSTLALLAQPSTQIAPPWWIRCEVR